MNMIVKDEVYCKVDELWRIETLREIADSLEKHECDYLVKAIDKMLLVYCKNNWPEDVVRGVLKYHYDKWLECNDILRYVKEKNETVK
jgi:hypothetical protein